jgi:tRNA threonylcarbamoyladenosine biosynthesis protein TsaB
MMVLGIETATAVSSVGLADENGLVAEFRHTRQKNHSESLAWMVESVCLSAEIQLAALSAVAVSTGPGSFTGLRIGLGYAKGLAFGLDIPLVGIPTLEALIWSVPQPSGWACVLLLARKGEAYRGLFQRQGDRWILFRDYDTVEEKSIFSHLPDDRILCVGNGAEYFRPVLERDSRITLTAESVTASGYSVAALGLKKFIAGDTADLDSLIPQYLKKFGVSR